MKLSNKKPGIKLRLVLKPDIALGPGKAEILKGIKETGSISAAGRRIGMSYKRAWQLVDLLNHHFKKPLVETSKGGQSHGGAQLTAMGEDVLAKYQLMLAKAEQAIAADMRKLVRMSANTTD